MGPRSTRTSAPIKDRLSPPIGDRPVRQTGAAALRAKSIAARAVLSETTERLDSSDRDIRRKRPPALSFLLRLATARRLARVLSLLALDFAAVALAIFTALVLKAAVLGSVKVTPALHETERILPFAYLLTALLFARSGLYAERAVRPGLSRIVGSLFQVAGVALVFAVVSGEMFSSYYLFYGTLAFALLFVSVLRYGFERITGAILRAAGYRR